MVSGDGRRRSGSDDGPWWLQLVAAALFTVSAAASLWAHDLGLPFTVMWLALAAVFASIGLRQHRREQGRI